MIINRRMFLQSAAAAGVTLPFASQFAMAQSGGSTLRVGLSDYPLSLRPARQGGYATIFCMSLAHARLVRYNTKGELVGELAESWELGEDDVWTFKLREGLLFSNGEPITANDLRYSIERMGSTELGYSQRALYSSITNIEIADERTVRVSTSPLNVALPHVFARPPFFVLAANSDSEENEQGIGAGPYILDSFERGVSLTYVPNPHYFKGKPAFESVHVVSYADENLRVAALLAGDVDLIDYVPWNAMSTIEDAPNVTLMQENRGAFMWMYFHGASGPFSDARLRKAVAFAIRREEIVQAVFYGRGAPLTGIPRPKDGGFYHEDQANYWSYNPDLVRQLMQEAGVPDGFECSLLSTSTYGMWRDTSVMVAAHLSEFGIKVNLVMPDWPTRVSMAQRGEGDICQTGSGLESLDPTAITYLRPGGAAVGSGSQGFEVSGLEELMTRGISEKDPVARREIYRQADQLALDNTTMVGVCYRATGFGISNSLGGFNMLPGELSPFSYHHPSEFYRI